MSVQAIPRFFGTGKPLRSQTPLRVNREASQSGIRSTTPSRFREFRSLNASRLTPSPQDLGRATGQSLKKVNSGRIVDITI